MKHFLDVGAHTGNTLTDFLSLTPEYDGWTVWCFEPSPRHFPLLIGTATRFTDRYTINLCPFGISGTSGVREFYLKDDPMGDSFEEILASDHLTVNLDLGLHLKPFCLNLEAFIQANIPKEDEIVLKLDCEGLEYEILESIQKPERFSKVLIEWHNIGSPHVEVQGLNAKFPQMEGWLL